MAMPWSERASAVYEGPLAGIITPVGAVDSESSLRHVLHRALRGQLRTIGVRVEFIQVTRTRLTAVD